jgi:hypothetical protein
MLQSVELFALLLQLLVVAIVVPQPAQHATITIIAPLAARSLETGFLHICNRGAVAVVTAAPSWLSISIVFNR